MSGRTFAEWAEHYGYQDTTDARADYERYKSELAILLKPSSALIPCQCPRCGWLGTLQDTNDLCPHCAIKTVVQKLGHKGLDRLRQEYRLLPKISYAQTWTKEQREERMVQIDGLFKHIGQSLQDSSGSVVGRC